MNTYCVVIPFLQENEAREYLKTLEYNGFIEKRSEKDRKETSKRII